MGARVTEAVRPVRAHRALSQPPTHSERPDGAALTGPAPCPPPPPPRPSMHLASPPRGVATPLTLTLACPGPVPAPFPSYCARPLPRSRPCMHASGATLPPADPPWSRDPLRPVNWKRGACAHGVPAGCQCHGAPLWPLPLNLSQPGSVPLIGLWLEAVEPQAQREGGGSAAAAAAALSPAGCRCGGPAARPPAGMLPASQSQERCGDSCARRPVNDAAGFPVASAPEPQRA